MVLLLRTFISFERKKSSGAKFADKLKCRIRAYSNQVTSLGTRPVFALNAHLVPKWRWILSGTGEKTFYPRSNLKNDL